MRFSKLETFVAVARYRNFTRAAQACHLVQSTISHQIRSLEDELGFALFERNSHTVTLTPAGEQFFRDIEKPLELLRHAVRRAQAVAAGETGALSVGVSGINQIERLNSVRRFRECHPNVAISYCRVRNRNVLHKLDKGSFDIALVGLHEELPQEYASVDVRNECLYLVAARNHPLAAFTRISLRDTLHYPLLFARDGDLDEEENRRDALRTIAIEDADTGNFILTEDMDIMQLMLETGEGIALVPESVIGFEQKKLAVIELIDPPPPIPIGWIFRRDNPNPVLHQFTVFLSENR